MHPKNVFLSEYYATPCVRIIISLCCVETHKHTRFACMTPVHLNITAQLKRVSNTVQSQPPIATGLADKVSCVHHPIHMTLRGHNPCTTLWPGSRHMPGKLKAVWSAIQAVVNAGLLSK